jgi:CubicO group peptidase (beta-lactamase class C family)
MAADLRELVETERERFGVPGVAVVVVADGEVVLADGFGQRDVESDEPVTADTAFAIASDTKCFTAATLCALADEGLVELDRPLRDYIPWFRLQDPHATELVSTRDLLCHRTGLPRHDMLWYGDVDISREEVVRRLRYLQPSKPFRQTWQYNNLAFDTAGYLTEHLLGCTWQEAVRSRLLDPLGMKHTGFSTREATDGDFAWPYKDVDGTFVRQGLPRKREGGPAGGIVSSAADMSRWVLARLGLEVDGARPLSDTALKELHTPVMTTGGSLGDFGERLSMGYALGCQVESYRGQRVIRHGGNLVGYSSDVCVAPDAKAAVVVLTNLHGTAIRDALALLVLDQLLGLEPKPWGERYHELFSAFRGGAVAAAKHRLETSVGASPPRPLKDYVGTYEHPAYGVFDVTLADVDLAGDSLATDFHGLGDVVSLQHREGDSWDLRLDDFDSATPLVFQSGLDGQIGSLAVALEPTVDPIVFTRRIDWPAAEVLDALAGRYRMGPIELVVLRTADGLRAQLPMSGAVALQPAGGTSFRVPGASGILLTFETDESGAVKQLVAYPMGLFDPAED